MRPTVLAALLLVATLATAPATAAKPTKHGTAAAELSELVVHSAEFNGTLQEGSSNGVYASIENTAAPTASAFTVRFDIDGSWAKDLQMPAGFVGYGSPNAPERWTATVGTHLLTVTVDADGQVPEADEANNVLTVAFEVQPGPPGPPDLRIQNGGFVDPVDQEGRSSRAWVVVENAGSSTQADALISFEVDGSSLGYATIPAGYAGTQAFQSPQAWTATAGSHSLRIVADAGQAIAESDEQNNAFTTTVTVQGGGSNPANLMIGDVQFNGSFVSGQTGRFGASVQNWNDPTPADTLVRFEVDGQWLGDAVLAAGFQGVRLVEAPQTWTASGGNHVMVVTADADNRLQEPREDDNSFSWSFWVQYDVTPPPARETLFTWWSGSNATNAVEDATLDVPSDYTGVWWDLHCTTSTVEAYLDGELMATCVQGVRTLLNRDSLAAGQHTFRVVYAGLDTAGVQVTGIPVQ